MAEFLESIINSESRLYSFKIKEYSEVAPEERLGEISFSGHKFFLFREKLNEKQNNMLLFRDDKVIYEFACWAYGFGDIDSFDLLVEDDRIVVKSSDFCHYDRETSFVEYIFLNPLSVNPLVCNCNFNTKPGRVLLKYPAY